MNSKFEQPEKPAWDYTKPERFTDEETGKEFYISYNRGYIVNLKVLFGFKWIPNDSFFKGEEPYIIGSLDKEPKFEKHRVVIFEFDWNSYRYTRFFKLEESMFVISHESSFAELGEPSYRIKTSPLKALSL